MITKNYEHLFFNKMENISLTITILVVFVDKTN